MRDELRIEFWDADGKESSNTSTADSNLSAQFRHHPTQSQSNGSESMLVAPTIGHRSRGGTQSMSAAPTPVRLSAFLDDSARGTGSGANSDVATGAGGCAGLTSPSSNHEMKQKTVHIPR